MKNILIIFAITVLAQFSIAQNVDLTLKVRSIEEAKGQICIVIYGSEEDYKNSKNQVWGDCIPVSSSDFEFIIDDLPKGIYVISIFHDVDSNKELNSNWIGIPKEPFGFSNDAKGKFGPPKFKDASIEIKVDMETTINLMRL